MHNTTAGLNYGVGACHSPDAMLEAIVARWGVDVITKAKLLQVP